MTNMPYISLSFLSNSNPCLMIKPLTITCTSSVSHEMASASNFYKLLSLSSNKAGIQEIKRAYRTLALKYHPDVCHHHDATKMFVLLQTAYKTLVDPTSRQEYDSTLGYREPGHGCVGCAFADHVREHKRWEDQIAELKIRSSYRVERKEGSWGSRVRHANKTK